MKISKIAIHNYRSISDCELECQDMLILLGQNNHGKSNILRALEFALTSSSKPDSKDIFAFANNDKEIWVELTFEGLTDQEATTWKKYVQPEGGFSFRKTAILNEGGSIDVSYNGYILEPEDEWLKSDNVGNYTNRRAINETPLKEFIPASGRISRNDVTEAQRQYIETNGKNLNFRHTLEKESLLGAKNIAAGTLPEFFLVPAVRDLSEESKAKGTSLFGKLLKLAVTKMANEDPRFSEVQKQLKELVDALNTTQGGENRPSQLAELEKSIESELPNWGVEVSVEVSPPDISQIFELGTDIHLDDGTKTLADRKGHGLQRAVILGLMKAWAKIMRPASPNNTENKPRKASETVVFAIEEPELFLHPHAQRDLYKALQTMAENENSQVFICSHSTHFVNLDNYRDIALIRKDAPDTGTTVIQCTQDLFEGESDTDRKRRFHMASWVNPDRGEMLFARKVVFVEGETEKTIFPYLAEKLECYSEDVSIVDCGSKNNLPLYIEIAKAFSLSYIVVHDEDTDPSAVQINQRIKEIVDDAQRIVVLRPDFEELSGISDNQRGNKGKALAALDHFDSISNDDIPSELISIVRAIYGE